MSAGRILLHRPVVPLRTRLITLAVSIVAAVLIQLTAVPPAAAQPGTSTGPTPGRYYLSLGDSLGFGLQFARLLAMLDNGTYTPTAFDTGYTDVFAALMRQLQPHQRVVNYSCPLTSTATMISGGCDFTDSGLALHDEFTGPQLDTAVNFLRDHPGQVDPITISVGAADLLDTFYGCNGDTACVLHSGLAEQLARNLATILGRLRTAAPHARILLLLPHNGAVFDLPHSSQLWATFILEMRALAATALSRRRLRRHHAGPPGVQNSPSCVTPTLTSIRPTPATPCWATCSTLLPAIPTTGRANRSTTSGGETQHSGFRLWVLALGDGLIDLHTAQDVIGLDGEQFLASWWRGQAWEVVMPHRASHHSNDSSAPVAADRNPPR